MTKKEYTDFIKMKAALERIAKHYYTPDQLRKKAGSMYGVSYEEALEMSYENIQEEARFGLKGVRTPKSVK